MKKLTFLFGNLNVYELNKYGIPEKTKEVEAQVNRW
jgi:hypothetical protein